MTSAARNAVSYVLLATSSYAFLVVLLS